MKDNFKKQLAIFALLILMAFVVFISMYILVIDTYIVLKIFTLIISIVATFTIFVMIKKINKQLVYIAKEDKVIEEKKVVEIQKKKILCPKCYNQYNGNCCFVCGYNTDKSLEQEGNES